MSNSEPTDAVDAGNPVCGVSLCTRRGTTQSWVKVPKCELSVILKVVPSPRQPGGELRSSYPLRKA